MSALMNVLGAYSIFVNLIPGILFYALAPVQYWMAIKDRPVVILLCLFYFTGIVIGRIGSIIIESVLESLRLIQNADYDAYVKAESKDKKIKEISQSSDLYRGLCSMSLLISLAYFYEGSGCRLGTFFILLFFLFLLSFIKQKSYVYKRVKANISSNEKP